MTTGDQPKAPIDYVGPEFQLPARTLDDRYVYALVDQLMVAAKAFKHHKVKENLLVIVRLAQELQSLGYTLVWMPRQGVVGAHRETVDENVN